MVRGTSEDLDQGVLLRDLKTIKQIVERLEGMVLSSGGTAADPYRRRRRILRGVYLSGNSVGLDDLEPVLRSQGTDYRWIAQQVKKGYLSVLPIPGGGKRYSVTPKAVRELQLTQEEDTEEVEQLEALAKLSEASFGEDWDNEEDAIYDKL